MEGELITALQENNHKYPPIHPLDPILQNKSVDLNETASKCLKWLDNQLLHSVMYVSFGGGATLSQELALGLEMSAHKFLWALRPPNEFTYLTYLGAQKDDPLEYLPKGFLERTNDRGLVVPSWAPHHKLKC